MALGRVAQKGTVRTNGNILGFDIQTVWGARAWECESQTDFSEFSKVWLQIPGIKPGGTQRSIKLINSRFGKQIW